MSAQANIVAYDGAGTPVLHTFTPVEAFRELDVLVSSWRENLTSVPVYACPKVTSRLIRQKSGVYRASVRVEIPVMEAVLNQNAAGYTAPPKVAHVVTQEWVGYYHERSTQADRKLGRQLLINILGNIATSVTPSTAGPAKELIDDLISAS